MSRYWCKTLKYKGMGGKVIGRIELPRNGVKSYGIEALTFFLYRILHTLGLNNVGFTAITIKSIRSVEHVCCITCWSTPSVKETSLGQKMRSYKKDIGR